MMNRAFEIAAAVSMVIAGFALAWALSGAYLASKGF
jgi:hypothetical protein